MTQIDTYLSQAIDSYPYDLKETIESLDYALSYDENNVGALCLYGRVYSEQMPRYEQAKSYFQKALSIDLQAIEVYPYYIQTLLLNEDFDEAKKLIDFAMTVKGINKLEVLSKKVQCLEILGEYDEVKQILKEMELLLLNYDFKDFIEETKKRISNKEKLLKETVVKKEAKKLKKK